MTRASPCSLDKTGPGRAGISEPSCSPILPEMLNESFLNLMEIVELHPILIGDITDPVNLPPGRSRSMEKFGIGIPRAINSSSLS